LLLASMGLFIALVERVGLLQIGRMLIFIGDQGRKAIDALYTPLKSSAQTADPAEVRGLPVTQTLAHAGPPQVIQALDMAALAKLAEEADAVIELRVTVGDTVVDLTPLLHVHRARQTLSERALRSAFEVGAERTFEQDPKYALRLVVGIAIRALSPAVNDPTTAVQALDQIEDLLLRLGRCPLEVGAFHDRQGQLRLLVPFPSWEDFLRLALDEIRSYGAESVQVMRRMKALISNLGSVLPAERLAGLRHAEERLRGSIARSFEDDEEKQEAAVADRQGLGLGEKATGGSPS
jgi:uncharacterized membrane protein